MGTGGERERAGFFERVYDMVEQIPSGTVATYGQIARLVGEPRKARFVGFALHSNPRPGVVPCHRVVFKDGSLCAGYVVFADGRVCEGFAFGGPGAQRALLEAEGVRFLDETHVDMERFRWQAGL